MRPEAEGSADCQLLSCSLWARGGCRDEHAAGCRQGSDGHCPTQPGEIGLRNVSLKGFILLMASTGEPYVL